MSKALLAEIPRPVRLASALESTMHYLEDARFVLNQARDLADPEHVDSVHLLEYGRLLKMMLRKLEEMQRRAGP